MNFLINSPLEQFEVVPLIPFFWNFNSIWIDLSFTNYSLYLLIIFVLIFIFLYVPTINSKIIPSSKWQYAIEQNYNFVLAVIKEQVGTQGQIFFPLYFLIFNFILFANLLGMTPYAFALTSHIILTLSIGVSIFIGLTILGFYRQGNHFLNVVKPPKGMISAIVPMILIIEIISYLSKPISLSVRLFANIMAGHTLLNIFSGFIFSFFKKSILIAILPLLLVIAICFLEFGISLLQAYVFLVLLSMYLSDSYVAGH